MKALFGVVLLAAAAYFGHGWYRDHQAFQAYENFAEAWVHEDRIAAARYGDDTTVKHALEELAIRGTRGGAAIATRSNRVRARRRANRSSWSS